MGQLHSFLKGKLVVNYSFLLLILTSCHARAGQGKDYFIWTSIFLALPILALTYFVLSQWVRKMKRSNTSFFLGSLRYFKLFFICIGMFIVSLLIVNYVALDRVYGESPVDKRTEGHLIKDTLQEYEGFMELVKGNYHDTKLMVEYIDFLANARYTGDLYEFKERIKSAYSDDIISKEYVEINNSTDAMLVSYVEYKLSNPEVAILYLNQYENDTIHYNCQLVAGYLYHYIEQYDKAEQAYLHELNNGNVASALQYLSYLYKSQKRYDDISHLSLQYDYWLEHIPLYIAIRASRYSFDVGLYLRSNCAHVMSGLNGWGVAGAFIITLAYFIFLYQVDVFRKEPILGLVTVFLLGCLSPGLVFYISDVLSDYTSIENNVFLKFVIQVGLVEELVKLIPFLLVLKFTKLIQEPYDFILYISLSALGFAFTENLIYFDINRIGLIQSRALTAVVVHMFCSSCVVYPIVYLNFKKEKKGTILPMLLGLIIASLAHGLYDIFAVKNLTPFFVLFFLYLIFNWGIMINNTLNNSPYFDLKKVGSIEFLRQWMSIVLLFVLLSEYVLRAFQLGSFWANDMLFGSFFSIFYLWIYISFSIGSLDFFRGYWEPVGYSENFKAIIFPRMANYRVYLGKNVVIKPIRGENPNGLEYLKGQIVSRRIVRGDKDWYVMKLRDKLNSPGFYNNIALVWFHEYDASITEDKDIPVKVHLIRETVNLKNIRIKETNILLRGKLNELKE